MTVTLVLDTFRNNPAFFLSVATVLGLLVGSFLNVVIYRLPVMMEKAWLDGAKQFLDEHQAQKAVETSPTESCPEPTPAQDRADEIDSQGQTADTTTDASTQHTETAEEPFNLVVPRSRCPSCGTAITAWQNIPVISYCLMRGKCGNCGCTISPRYPLVEAICGLITFLLAYQFGVTWAFLAACFFSWTLLAASFIDYDHYLLPDQMTLPLLWLGLLIATQSLYVPLLDAVLGAAFGYLSLWCVFWTFKLITKKDGMGYGDFKLLAALGAWCGWMSLPSIIVLSSMVGAVFGITLIVFCGRDRAKPIPFGPYLAAAGWLYFLYGDTIDIRHWLF